MQLLQRLLWKSPVKSGKRLNSLPGKAPCGFPAFLWYFAICCDSFQLFWLGGCTREKLSAGWCVTFTCFLSDCHLHVFYLIASRG
jgi:hypothetical protein